MAEDPRTEAERKAGLNYEQMMAKRMREAQEAEKNRIQAQNGGKEKKEKKETKEPLVELESIKIGKVP